MRLEGKALLGDHGASRRCQQRRDPAASHYGRCHAGLELSAQSRPSGAFLVGLALGCRRGEVSQTRRLAAILAADVAGYSRLIGADEGALSKLSRRSAKRCSIRRSLRITAGWSRRRVTAFSPSSAASSTQCAALSKFSARWRSEMPMCRRMAASNFAWDQHFRGGRDIYGDGSRPGLEVQRTQRAARSGFEAFRLPAGFDA